MTGGRRSVGDAWRRAIAPLRRAWAATGGRVWDDLRREWAAPPRFAPGEVELLGEPGGDGAWLLREELTRLIADYGGVDRAWLTRVRYRGDLPEAGGGGDRSRGRVRVAVVLDTPLPPAVAGPDLVDRLRGLADLDLLFLDALPPAGRAAVTAADPFHPV